MRNRWEKNRFKLINSRSSFLWDKRFIQTKRPPPTIPAPWQDVIWAEKVLFVPVMLRTQAFFCSRKLYNCLSVCTIKRLQIFKMVLLARHCISQQLKKCADVFQTFPSSKARCSCSQHFKVQLKKASSRLLESHCRRSRILSIIIEI